MNSSRKKSKKVTKNRNIALIFIFLFVFYGGYIVLNDLSTMEKPPMSNTVLIIIGCMMMAVSGIIIAVTLKRQFFPKKQKKSKHIYLKDQLKNTKKPE